jgi:hypothetical protein
MALAAAASAYASGSGEFAMLLLPLSAKQAAMGSADLLPQYNDPSQLARNPSLLDSSMHCRPTAAYSNLYTAAHSMSAAIAWQAGMAGSMGITAQALAYGSMQGYDEYGIAQGEFSASSIALTAHWAHGFGAYFNLGINLKGIISQLERYAAAAAAMDIALRWSSMDARSILSFAACNVGMEFKPYYDGAKRQSMPLDLRIGVAHKLAAAPIGISFYLNNLHQWSLYRSHAGAYEEETQAARIFGEALCHMGVGLGIYPSQRFYLMAGYQYLRSNELGLENVRYFNGFSAGAALRLPYVEIAYSWAAYHAAGGAHNVSISIDLRHK